MMLGDETKDQDRARWFEPGQIACVCDGVTSSPNSAQAAEMVSSFIPVVFNGNSHDKLAVQCELLMALRGESQQSDVTPLPGNMSAAMQDMLRKVVREKQASSFQTTMIAAKFTADHNMVLADVRKFGDSAFFACSSQGQLLTSSLTFPYDAQSQAKSSGLPAGPFGRKTMSFGPGDEILVRIEGPLLDSLALAERAGIKAEHATNWLVCAAIDSCRSNEPAADEKLSDLQTLSLDLGDRLLVPKYLYGTQLTSQGHRYRVLRYSSTVRPVLSRNPLASMNTFSKAGSTTRVLPDHFYRGSFDSFKDRFPPRTHFILCSDGFYGSFCDWQQLWTWLRDNAPSLNHKDERDPILKKLHHDLHTRGGDDDISFVWVQPGTPDRAQSDREGGDNVCPSRS